MSHAHQGILLRAVAGAEALQVSIDAAQNFRQLFQDHEAVAPAENKVNVTPLPLNKYLSPDDAIIVIHRTGSSDSNRLTDEILAIQQDKEASSSGSVISLKGHCYITYQDSSKDFLLRPDWEALHETCYGARLDNAAKKQEGQETSPLSLQDLAEQFQSRLKNLRDRSTVSDVKMEEDGEDNWTDEEVEKPREPKPEIESDDEAMDGAADDNEDNGNDDDDDEDSEASYEDESELESDDEDDPRKKALLDMIKASIMKDGKLDLER